jgi:hypothetical protein
MNRAEIVPQRNGWLKDTNQNYPGKRTKRVDFLLPLAERSYRFDLSLFSRYLVVGRTIQRVKLKTALVSGLWCCLKHSATGLSVHAGIIPHWTYLVPLGLMRHNLPRAVWFSVDLTIWRQSTFLPLMQKSFMRVTLSRLHLAARLPVAADEQFSCRFSSKLKFSQKVRSGELGAYQWNWILFRWLKDKVYCGTQVLIRFVLQFRIKLSSDFHRTYLRTVHLGNPSSQSGCSSQERHFQARSTGGM